jgi:S1-C subfamily serine protease
MQGYFKLFTKVALIVILAHATGLTQKMETRTMMFDPESTVIIPGLGAIVELTDDTLTVSMIPPAGQRPEIYREVDIQPNDRILMANGRRLRTIADLRGLLDSLETGTVIKLGLARDGRMMMASFARADDSAPGGPMMIKRTIGGSGQTTEKVMSFGGHGGVEGTVAVLDAGLIIGPAEGSLKVVALLPQASERIKGEVPAEGDLIISVNDNIDTDIQAFQAVYDDIPDGETVTVIFEREGKRHTATYVKTAMKPGATVIDKN